MQQIIVTKIKHISTTTPYPLGYKYNCEIMYCGVKLPTKAFTKNGSRVLQIMIFKKMWITET